MYVSQTQTFHPNLKLLCLSPKPCSLELWRYYTISKNKILKHSYLVTTILFYHAILTNFLTFFPSWLPKHILMELKEKSWINLQKHQWKSQEIKQHDNEH